MMNFKRYLKPISALMALVVIMASSGAAFSVHYCHGNRTATSFYGGLYSEGNLCSCEHSGPGLVSTDSHPGPAFNKFHCCKNKVFFEKIQTMTHGQVSQESVPYVLVFFPLQHLRTNDLANPVEPEARNHGPGKTPPFPSLSLAIHFHHLRIPLPESDC